jgi:hypothetical protein
VHWASSAADRLYQLLLPLESTLQCPCAGVVRNCFTADEYLREAKALMEARDVRSLKVSVSTSVSISVSVSVSVCVNVSMLICWGQLHRGHRVVQLQPRYSYSRGLLVVCNRGLPPFSAH